jgi:transcriptional antiterminator
MEILQRMHKLIDASCTGTPCEFAKQLRISERHLRKIIDEMKDLGAPIDYSRRNKTYHYAEPFEINISCVFKYLSTQEEINISAGNTFILNFSLTAFFVP